MAGKTTVKSAAKEESAVKTAPVAETKAQEEVKAENAVKAEEKKEEKAPAKAARKTVTKKTTTRKTTTKKAAEKAEEKEAEKPAVKRTAKKADVAPVVHLQFGGRSYSIEDIQKMAADVWKYDLQREDEYTSLALYVKPEENRAYYVFNEDIAGSFGI